MTDDSLYELMRFLSNLSRCGPLGHHWEKLRIYLYVEIDDRVLVRVDSEDIRLTFRDLASRRM